MKRIEEQYKLDTKSTLNEYNNQITTLEHKIFTVETNIQDEKIKYDKLNTEYMILKNDHENETAHLNYQLKKSIDEIEKLKKSIYVDTVKNIEELIYEKDQIRHALTSSIHNLRQTHISDINKMNCELENEINNTISLSKELTNIKLEYTDKINKAYKDVD